MSAWTRISIGELGSVVTGRTPPSAQKHFFDGSIPFLTPTDLDWESRFVVPDRFVSTDWNEQQKRISLPPNAICVVCIGATIGKVCMVATVSQSNQQINSIVVDPKCFDAHFVYYRMRVMREQLKSRAAGAATPILNKSAFSAISIDVPPLPIQRRIASVLGAYDDLIEVNRRQIALLEEMARGLFEEWFVRFRFPGHEDCEVVQTPEGPMPEGWRRVALGALCSDTRDAVSPADIESDTPYVGLEHIPRRSTTLNEWERADEVTSTKLRFRGGDILFGKIRPYFHKVVFAPFEGVCSSDAIVIRSYAPEFTGIVLAVTSSDNFVAHAIATSNGTKMPRANWNVLARSSVPLPPDDLMRRFNDAVVTWAKLAATLIASNIRLAASRDLLLPRLISGEVSVSAAEHELETAA